MRSVSAKMSQHALFADQKLYDATLNSILMQHLILSNLGLIKLLSIRYNANTSGAFLNDFKSDI